MKNAYLIAEDCIENIKNLEFDDKLTIFSKLAKYIYSIPKKEKRFLDWCLTLNQKHEDRRTNKKPTPKEKVFTTEVIRKHCINTNREDVYVLNNKRCYIFFTKHRETLNLKTINGSDLTDSNNSPSFYTKKKRNLKKAWKEVEKKFNDDTTMNDVENILDKYTLNCHVFNGMD